MYKYGFVCLMYFCATFCGAQNDHKSVIATGLVYNVQYGSLGYFPGIRLDIQPKSKNENIRFHLAYNYYPGYSKIQYSNVGNFKMMNMLHQFQTGVLATAVLDHKKQIRSISVGMDLILDYRNVKTWDYSPVSMADYFFKTKYKLSVKPGAYMQYRHSNWVFGVGINSFNFFTGYVF